MYIFDGEAKESDGGQMPSLSYASVGEGEIFYEFQKSIAIS